MVEIKTNPFAMKFVKCGTKAYVLQGLIESEKSYDICIFGVFVSQEDALTTLGAMSAMDQETVRECISNIDGLHVSGAEFKITYDIVETQIVMF